MHRLVDNIINLINSINLAWTDKIREYWLLLNKSSISYTLFGSSFVSSGFVCRTDLDLLDFDKTVRISITTTIYTIVRSGRALFRLSALQTFRLWIRVVTNFQKDLFQGSDRDTISLNFQCLQVIVEVCEEVFEQGRVFTRDLDCHFSLDFSQFTDIWSKFFNHVWHNLFIDGRVVLDNSHDIAHSKAILEEH